MRKILWALLLLAASGTHAQVFWTETFSNACSSGCTANGYNGPNGTWTSTATGTNLATSNIWFVSGTECGNAAGQCGTSCGSSDPSLHMGSNIIFAFDPGAAYYAVVESYWRAESPTINCTGKSNITVSFNYIMEGQAGVDFGTVCYYDGTTWYYYNGASWSTTFSSMPTSNNASCAPQGLWTAYSVLLPASANNNASVKIGFRWVNDNDGLGTDPSFAVDDINISSSAPACAVNIIPGLPILCFGDCNASVTAVATGVAPFQYSWNTFPVQNTATAVNLCSSTYTVTVTDSVGCIATASATINQPSLLTVTITGNNYNGWGEPCNGDCFDTLVAHPLGGTPPYSYLWSNGNTTPITPGMCTGTYTVTVQDANGCSATASYSVIQPPVLTVIITGLDFNGWGEPCNGACDDSLMVNASGGTPPYSFLWSSGCANAACPNVCAGTYTVTVTDANGCTATASYTVLEPPVLTVVITGVNFLGWGEPCHGDCLDTLTAHAFGGNPLYSYIWSNGCNTPSCGNTCAGTYTVTVTDVNGCTASASYTVIEPPPLILGPLTLTNPTCNGCPNGIICLTPNGGGTPPYTYSMTPTGNFNGNCWLNLSAGIYTVCIIDLNNCITCLTDTLVDPPSGIPHNFSGEQIVLSPTIISTSAVLTIPFLEQEFLFTIYDAFGKKVREKFFNGREMIVERENLLAGLYFFELKGNQRRIYTGKFIVE